MTEAQRRAHERLSRGLRIHQIREGQRRFNWYGCRVWPDGPEFWQEKDRPLSREEIPYGDLLANREAA